MRRRAAAYTGGQCAWISATIHPHQILEAFEELFETGLAVLWRELRRFLGLAQSIGILFCGGSFCNPGLLWRVGGLLEEERKGQDQVGRPAQLWPLLGCSDLFTRTGIPADQLRRDG